MKKILLLLAVLGGIAFLVQRRRQAAAAEAALWDEATKPTTERLSRSHELGPLPRRVDARWPDEGSWGRSSIGRAPPLQGGGWRFDSARLHQS